MALLALILFVSVVNCVEFATVYMSNGSYTCEVGKMDPKGVAYGRFEDTLFEKGFYTYISYTNENYEDSEQAYAIGFLEGCMQADVILFMYKFVRTGSVIFMGAYGGALPPKLDEYLTTQISWVNEQIKSTNTSNSTHQERVYWTNVGLVYDQLQGIAEGFSKFNNIGVSVTLKQFMGFSIPDSMNLVPYLGDELDEKGRKIIEDITLSGHCSTLVKLLEGNKDIIFSHTLWYIYNVIVLEYKEYHIQFKGEFSSQKTSIWQMGWPGMIDSGTHFQISDRGVAVTETTIDTLDPTIYKSITPNSLFAYVRSVIGSRISSSATEFVEIFSKHNSGSGNSQWHVLDLNKFTPGEELPPETIWMIEQCPLYIESVDVTANLTKDGYVSSYNIPFSANVRKDSGFDAYIGSHPKVKDILSFQNCPRARLFAELHEEVVDIPSAKKIIRDDDWSNPLALNNPAFTIASRCEYGKPMDDYPWPLPVCSGALDGKILSANDWNEDKSLHFIVSPPYDHNPVFDWSKSELCGKEYHEGLPDAWKFGWYELNGSD